MMLVSVTRFRARSMLFVPLLMLHGQRAIAQLYKAEGYLNGSVRRDSDFAFWTMSAWADEPSVQAYVASGAHRAAMPHLLNWAIEASIVRWFPEDGELPEWSEATARMRRDGRPSKLRHPGPHHADMSFADAQASHQTRL